MRRDRTCESGTNRKDREAFYLDWKRNEINKNVIKTNRNVSRHSFSGGCFLFRQGAGGKERNMNANHIKAVFSAAFGFLTSLLGILAIPVVLMVSCNVIDYITGLMASDRRGQEITSYKGLRGIRKKVCMWLLVVVGAIIDQLLLYASATVGIGLTFTFLVACIVALWIICNEIISILENIKDMGVPIPSFLTPLIRNIKSQVEAMGEQQTGDTEENDREGE